MLKEKSEETPNYFPINKTWTTEQIIENLPYSLTGAQLNTWHEIERDMSGQALMSRLVQGDVGSGKTIIAFLAMILACENGYQAALMHRQKSLPDNITMAFSDYRRNKD